MRYNHLRKHLPRLARSVIITLSVASISEIRAGDGTNSTVSFDSSVPAASPQHHFSFEQSIESLGQEIVHPKDPYQVIPGRDPNDWCVIIEPELCLPTISGTASAKGLPPVDIQKKVNLSDRSQWANTSFAFARQLKNMLELSRTVVQGALLRDESRGAHYKPDFPDRNDAKFLKTTKASFTGDAAGPRFEYEEVDTQFIKPRPRRYDATK